MKEILLAPLDLIASPFALTTAKSCKVTLSEVTNSPCAPDFWLLNSRMEASIPSPSILTPGISKESPSSITKVPPVSLTTSPGSAIIKAS